MSLTITPSCSRLLNDRTFLGKAIIASRRPVNILDRVLGRGKGGELSAPAECSHRGRLGGGQRAWVHPRRGVGSWPGSGRRSPPADSEASGQRSLPGVKRLRQGRVVLEPLRPLLTAPGPKGGPQSGGGSSGREGSSAPPKKSFPGESGASCGRSRGNARTPGLPEAASCAAPPRGAPRVADPGAAQGR